MKAVTRQCPFESLGGDQQYALAVREGCDADDVLELCSCRLSEVLELLRESAERGKGLTQNMVYILSNEIETAKAMVDSCTGAFISMEAQQ